MKKIGVWSSTNPGGRKTKTVLQKHRVKALDHGWRLKCVETKTEALCPPHSRLTSEIRRPKSCRKQVADSLIGPRVSTAIYNYYYYSA